ncbi:MAG: thioether cross-link-forming SCIFF peptide maturase, partial [Oscillospiraceae bacterium]|nr:thioether cross-link-forming SCIFF peptide maturase [Oscillospiraceae bacterium]
MIHQYQLNGYNIVLDSPSGAVHVVDPVAYDAIALYEQYPEDEIVEKLLSQYHDQPDVTEAELRLCLSEIAQLKAAGKLFSEETY